MLKYDGRRFVVAGLPARGPCLSVAAARCACVQVGYCPQRDPLLELLTPREHLQLYARIKGVPEKNLPEVVEAKLKVRRRLCRRTQAGLSMLLTGAVVQRILSSLWRRVKIDALPLGTCRSWS